MIECIRSLNMFAAYPQTLGFLSLNLCEALYSQRGRRGIAALWLHIRPIQLGKENALPLLVLPTCSATS